MVNWKQKLIDSKVFEQSQNDRNRSSTFVWDVITSNSFTATVKVFFPPSLAFLFPLMQFLTSRDNFKI